jgi:hypothetical protein
MGTQDVNGKALNRHQACQNRSQDAAMQGLLPTMLERGHKFYLMAAF